MAESNTDADWKSNLQQDNNEIFRTQKLEYIYILQYCYFN